MMIPSRTTTILAALLAFSSLLLGGSSGCGKGEETATEPASPSSDQLSSLGDATVTLTAETLSEITEGSGALVPESGLSAVTVSSVPSCEEAAVASCNPPGSTQEISLVCESGACSGTAVACGDQTVVQMTCEGCVQGDVTLSGSVEMSIALDSCNISSTLNAELTAVLGDLECGVTMTSAISSGTDSLIISTCALVCDQGVRFDAVTSYASSCPADDCTGDGCEIPESEGENDGGSAFSVTQVIVSYTGTEEGSWGLISSSPDAPTTTYDPQPTITVTFSEGLDTTTWITQDGGNCNGCDAVLQTLDASQRIDLVTTLGGGDQTTLTLRPASGMTVSRTYLLHIYNDRGAANAEGEALDTTSSYYLKFEPADTGGPPGPD